ncbi:cell division protein FtsL [Oceanomicrobium pacificus]|uniref:Cell division protein FtsL n=1 Tax=Oceanomicrobium pacificus TaxID=2692916 RepID=A0A6B0TV01_9RHOB|nr:cell division protein FtsL [Oceanomicrobium pacificus]MXU65418.1 cell division protein FtsL [Oceanomicrobium pacificus]
MKTILYLSCVTLVIGVATFAYQVNYDTQEALRRVEALTDEIARERAAISVLEAEWAYLNRPDRLLALAEEHFETLKLMPLHPDHFAEPASVVYPPQKFQSVDEALAALIAEGAVLPTDPETDL